MESIENVFNVTSHEQPTFILNDSYGENFEFEKDIIYIDSRENDNTLDTFKEYIRNNTEKEESGLNKHYKGYCRLNLTGNRYLPYKTWKRTQLPVGDFMYNGIVFELKRGYDLYDSVTGDIKRLDVQIDNARKLLRKGVIQDYQVFCTMEGNFYGNKFNEFNYFSNQEGLIPIQYYGIDECIKGMFNVWNSSTKLKRLRTNYIPKLNPAYLVLYSLDSCTRKKAEAIYHKFHPFYISDLDNLTEKKLLECKGIGEKTAANIYEELNAILHRPRGQSMIIYDKEEVNVY